MKLFFIDFLLYFYVNHIKEDFEVFNTFGKVVIYPAWFIRSVLMWVISPIFVIPFAVKRTDFYKNLKKRSDEMMVEFLLKNKI